MIKNVQTFAHVREKMPSATTAGGIFEGIARLVGYLAMPAMMLTMRAMSVAFT